MSESSSSFDPVVCPFDNDVMIGQLPTACATRNAR
jgi:hypothetical protein